MRKFDCYDVESRNLEPNLHVSAIRSYCARSRPIFAPKNCTCTWQKLSIWRASNPACTNFQGHSGNNNPQFFQFHQEMLSTMQNFLHSSPQAKLGYALMAVGALKATEHLVGLAEGAWKHLLRPRRWLKSRYSRSDAEPWVMISG